MKKAIRILALLLVLVSLLGIVPAPASAVEYGFDENSGWYWPTVGDPYKNISRNGGFGVYRSSDKKYHQGYDIAVVTGTKVYAARSGTVYKVGYDPKSMGHYICLYHGTNSAGKHIFSTYMHLSKILLKKDSNGNYLPVSIGDPIALSGNTGAISTGAHLHFHVFRSTSATPGTPSPARDSWTNLTVNYVDVSKITYNGSSTLSISVTSSPTLLKVGQGYGMRGSVTSNYKITEVRGIVYNRNTGREVMSSMDYPNSTSMNIQYSNVNNALIFNDLPRGDYRLEIHAKDKSGNTYHWSSDFIVRHPIVTTSGGVFPSKIKKGSCFGLRGIVTSTDFTITKVRGEIIRKSDGYRVDQTWDYPNSTYFDIRYSNLNNNLEFNLLKTGNYTFKYTVYLSCGNTFTYSRDFKVTWW